MIQLSKLSWGKKVEKHKIPWNLAYLLFTHDRQCCYPSFIISHHSLSCSIRICNLLDIKVRFCRSFGTWGFREQYEANNNKQNTHLGTFCKCYLINSHNTSKRYYYPCYCWRNLTFFSILHLYSSYWDTSVLHISIPILCFPRISQRKSLINRVGVNGCIHIFKM